jgi:hypothetical protein
MTDARDLQNWAVLPLVPAPLSDEQWQEVVHFSDFRPKHVPSLSRRSSHLRGSGTQLASMPARLRRRASVTCHLLAANSVRQQWPIVVANMAGSSVPSTMLRPASGAHRARDVQMQFDFRNEVQVVRIGQRRAHVRLRPIPHRNIAGPVGTSVRSARHADAATNCPSGM